MTERQATEKMKGLPINKMNHGVQLAIQSLYVVVYFMLVLPKQFFLAAAKRWHRVDEMFVMTSQLRILEKCLFYKLLKQTFRT